MASTVQTEQQIPTILEKIPAQIYIDGWRQGNSERSVKITNPYDDTVLATIQLASKTDVDDAFASARAAQPRWATKTPAERAAILVAAADYMQEHFDELVQLLSAESGSSATKAGIEISGTIAATREAATFPTRAHGKIMPSNVPGKENRVYREPVGVVGVISPWNFPMLLSQRSVAPALALGNTVVLKPATDTPLTGGLILAKVFEEAGLPAGVLNVVPGTGSEIGDHFVLSEVPSLITFTGSTPVGKRVGELAMSGPYLKKVALELGGNAPIVVLSDANLQDAVPAAAMAKFLHQGQICMAANRIIVEAPIYDAFVEAFGKHVENISYGDVANPANLVGPIINDEQLQSVTGKIALARDQGAREIVTADVVGRVVPPHVFADVTRDMELFREEIFGPVVGIIRADNEAHALELANDTEFGLSSSVFTSDIERGVRFARGIRAGMTHVNDISVADEPHVMFGGEKNSGLGRFNGEWAIEEFTTDHWISVKSE